MSKNNDQSNSFRDRKALRSLINDLSAVNGQTLSTSVADNEMLSLIVDEAIKGINIAQRYPDFYKKLLDNAILRETFLEVLESMEPVENDEMITFSDFLENQEILSDLSSQPTVERDDENWHISWLRTIDQLRTIFSPSRLAYRSDPNLYEDPWFMLLRSDVEVEGVSYSVLLECTFSEEDKEALTPFLNVAVTVERTSVQARFPIRSSLQWGIYKESIQITEEGRVRFPDIPLPAIFDKENKNVSAELDLIIETRL